MDSNWLESLVKHPIFELNDQEKLDVKKADFNKTRIDNSTVDFLLQHHNHVLALRDNDLFVAVGSTIRVLNLTAFKDSSLKADKKLLASTHYKVLDTPEINFCIESLIPNKNGKLLAVKGKNRLVIVCLPRQGFGDISEIMARRKVECRTLSVGTAHYEKSQIIKAQWHPLSENHTHLVVLGDNNVLRIFDISVDLDEPEQYFDLSPVKGGASSNGATNNDVVSFALGGVSKDQSGWEPFSVFYTLRNGDIYALSPVLPYRSSVRRDHLENLKYITKAKQENSASEALSHLYKVQMSWINTLFQSAKKTTLDGGSLLVRSDKNHSIYPVQRQGPFVTNEGEKSGEATDMLYINADPVHVLVLAFTNGTVKNYIVGSDINAQWQFSAQDPNEAKLGEILSSTDYLPKASLYESINLKSHDLPKYQSMTLVADPLYEDTFFIYHATGVHAVSITKWVQALRKINSNFESGNDSEAQRALDVWLKESVPSDVRTLVDSSPFSDGYVPIIGLIVITDMYLSYSLLTLTVDYTLVTTDLLVRRESTASKKSQEAVKEQLKHVADEDDNKSLLSLPAYQVPPQLESLPSQTKVVIPDNIKNVVVNEETLEFIKKFSKQVRGESDDIKKNITKVQTRLSSQQNEFERQVKYLRNVNDKYLKYCSDEARDNQEKQIKGYYQKHNELRLRMEQQVQFLMQNYQSQDEESWMEKMQALSNQVSGYAKKIDLLKAQMKELSLKKRKANVTLKPLLRELNEQTNTIKDVDERVRALESKVSV